MNKQAIAYHEAGHAVIAALLRVLGDDSCITIQGDGCELGSVTFSKPVVNNAWKRWGLRYTRKAILAFYAGPAASMKLDPSVDLFEEGGLFELDFFRANDLCRWLGDGAVYEESPKSVLQTAHWKQSSAMVQSNWLTITEVAKTLCALKTLTGTQVKALSHRVISAGPDSAAIKPRLTERENP